MAIDDWGDIGLMDGYECDPSTFVLALTVTRQCFLPSRPTDGRWREIGGKAFKKT